MSSILNSRIMSKDIQIEDSILEKWQKIVDILAEVNGVPVALIMRVTLPDIMVFRSSQTDGNPYKVGEKEHLMDSGLYCETVINSREMLLVPNALKDKDWDHNPDIKLGMISYLGYPIEYPDGSIFGTLCILDSNENAYNETTKKILIRFKDIIEDNLRLIALNKRYEEAYEDIKFYKDILSHDISNSIQLISSSLNLYFTHKRLKTEESINVDELLGKIHNSADRAKEIIRKVRALSKIEEGKMELEPLELMSLMKEVIRNVEESHDLEKLEISLDSKFQEVHVNANNLIKNVFENILTNAINHNDNPVKNIAISISETSLNDKKYVKFEFLDNGRGILDERKKLIFEKGIKKSQASRGMGLGLSLVKKLVEKFNGKIWVKDRIQGKPSEGTNLSVLLPMS